jgi:hypothetical protein
LHGKTGTAALRTQSYAVENSELFRWTFLTAMAVCPEALNKQTDYFAGFLFAMRSFVSAFCISSDSVNAERGLQNICAFSLDFLNQIRFNIMT